MAADPPPMDRVDVPAVDYRAEMVLESSFMRWAALPSWSWW